MNDHPGPAILGFMRDPVSYPHRPREVGELHTHASVVFLVPPPVYKIKKPVNLGFLDFFHAGKTTPLLPTRGEFHLVLTRLPLLDGFQEANR